MYLRNVQTNLIPIRLYLMERGLIHMHYMVTLLQAQIWLCCPLMTVVVKAKPCLCFMPTLTPLLICHFHPFMMVCQLQALKTAWYVIKHTIYLPRNNCLIISVYIFHQVKIWHIPEKGLEESLSQPECTFSHKQRRVETVVFHPSADFLLTSTSYATVTLWDITTEKEMYCKFMSDTLIRIALIIIFTI